jgi:ABC-type hemin transport system substrate-binding protein
MGTPWVTEAVEAATGSSVAPDVVCRLVQGADGAPRYKLDEDCIRQLQPSLVVVACDENNGEEQEPHQQHYQQLKARAGVSAAGAVAPQHGSSRAISMLAGSCSSTVNVHVAVPGRVRLDPHVVQRVLQRAGVWGDGRAVVLYQRCHSLAEVLEFMQVLAQAAGVPERGAVLVDGLRAKLRAAAGRVSLASEALAASVSNSRSILASRRSSRRGSVTGSGPGADAAAWLAGAAGKAAGPSVMVLGCTSPLSLVGFWVPEMLQLLGLEPTTSGPAPGEAPVELSWAQLRDAGPDVLVLALPGLPAAQAGVHLADLAILPGFWGLPAVRSGAVYAVDHVLLLRPGPSLVVGLEVLSHLVAPESHPMPAGLPLGSVLKLSLHGGQRCRPRLVPHYMSRYC